MGPALEIPPYQSRLNQLLPPPRSAPYRPRPTSTFIFSHLLTPHSSPGVTSPDLCLAGPLPQSLTDINLPSKTQHNASFFLFLSLSFIFLATLLNLQDLSSLTGD